MSNESTVQSGQGSAAVLRFEALCRPNAGNGFDGEPARDASGYAVFSNGDVGAAHVMAHRMLDSGRIELGRRQLGTWLQGRTGSGSDWVHLHFHMAVFELASGDWHAAHRRFLAEVLPIAARTEEALTDAPALLWRLALSAPEPVCLPWQPLRRTAVERMRRPSDPFVEVHNLLAVAGAGDVAGIEQWLDARTRAPSTQTGRLVESMGVALYAYATGAFGRAAATLHDVLPQLSTVGGSRAQNELFQTLEHHCWRLAYGGDGGPAYAHAA